VLVVNCETERVQRDSVVIECKCAINPITNPNPVYNHLTRDNIDNWYDSMEEVSASR
jgi:aryl-alcohol dehydrogenase-like predicted oxidoreductase